MRNFSRFLLSDIAEILEMLGFDSGKSRSPASSSMLMLNLPFIGFLVPVIFGNSVLTWARAAGTNYVGGGSTAALGDTLISFTSSIRSFGFGGAWNVLKATDFTGSAAIPPSVCFVFAA